jgi:hypoxia up-regulated 1
MKLSNFITWIISALHVYSSVIGIDFGTDWLKVSVIKPGGSIETVLNRESKRKTNAVMNIRKGVRSFGIEASNLGTRFPKTTYSNLKSLLGKEFTSVNTKEYLSRFTNDLLVSERNTVLFKYDDETNFSVEELVANLLAHCRRQAEKYAAITVSGAVITVPPHFTHLERMALLDAADIAKLKVYSLINDQSAGKYILI